ncbi:MAG: sodium/proton-translocating pyrophosphatase, partial [Candidatus Pacebacteria bacterium]|nr:sodium/proton-translocating pyrophosphatase [Candidatus Paceibacterota bacterium]
MINYLIFIPVAAALLYSIYLIIWIRKQKPGNERMEKISRAILEGSRAYLNRQYKTVAVVAIILFLIIWYALGIITAYGFLTGAIASALAGYIGMNVAVKSNSKTTA